MARTDSDKRFITDADADTDVGGRAGGPSTATADVDRGEPAGLEGLLKPVDIGTISIGLADEVNCPHAEERPATISRFEARLLAKHWIEQIRWIVEAWFAFGQTGSQEIRLEPYAYSRLDGMIHAGLLSVADVDAVAEEVFQIRPDSGGSGGTEVDGVDELGIPLYRPETQGGPLLEIRAALVAEGNAYVADRYLFGTYRGVGARLPPLTFPTGPAAIDVIRNLLSPRPN